MPRKVAHVVCMDRMAAPDTVDTVSRPCHVSIHSPRSTTHKGMSMEHLLQVSRKRILLGSLRHWQRSADCITNFAYAPHVDFLCFWLSHHSFNSICWQSRLELASGIFVKPSGCEGHSAMAVSVLVSHLHARINRGGW